MVHSQPTVKSECPVCGQTSDSLAFVVREMMLGTREAFRYLQCLGCESLHIENPPSDMARFYGGEYYSLHDLSSGGPIQNVLRFVKKVRDSYNVLGKPAAGSFVQLAAPEKGGALHSLKPIGLTRGARILDVGCGAGAVPLALKNVGIKKVVGIDPFLENDLEYDNGLKVYRKTLYDVEEDGWDLVMFHHALEHMTKPRSVLERASSIIRKGGTCLIRTPIVPSFAWEKYGANWVQLDAPRHFQVFSLKGLESLGNRVGLQLEKVVYDSTEFQFWGSEQNANDIPMKSDRSYDLNRANSVFSGKQIRDWRKKSKKLNSEGRGDQAAVIFRKS